MYDSYLREYKGKQSEILGQMQDHSSADEQFYLTANMTLNIAKRAKEIFVSSEPEEKRQFLGFMLQNCTLNEKKLGFSLRSPFNVIINHSDNTTMRAWRDSFRTFEWEKAAPAPEATLASIANLLALV